MPEEKFPWTDTQGSYCNLWKASFYYVENGMGRYITIDEAKAIVKK